MFKSIFSKYFAAVSLVVCIAFAMMAAAQTVVSAQSWVNQKQELLAENACRVADNVAQNSHPSAHSETDYVLNMDKGSTVPVVIQMLSSTIEADVLITDNRGVICAGSSGEPAGQTISGTVAEDVITALQKDGEYFRVDTLGGLYDERHYTAGTPIIKGGTTIGYVFVASSAGDLKDYLLYNLQTYLISLLAVLVLSCVVIYIFTDRLVRPLRNMAAATHSFGEGDFSYRLPVKGRDEMAELATALNNMAVSLSESEGANRAFIANVSHELRTPMTTISGFVDGILDGTIPKDKAEYYLKIVSDEIRRLSRLVQSMLNLSRIDNQSLQLRPSRFDLTEQLSRTLLTFEPRIEEKQVQVTGLDDCDDCPVTADADLIGQVVYNLLDNAVKFINPKGELSLRVERDGDRAVVTVRNSGSGIPSEEMPHIFDRFYKSDRSRSLDKTGVGLGLFIVKSIISLHRGEIFVRSVEGEYAEFAFWIPADRADGGKTDHSEKISK